MYGSPVERRHVPPDETERRVHRPRNPVPADPVKPGGRNHASRTPVQGIRAGYFNRKLSQPVCRGAIGRVRVQWILVTRLHQLRSAQVGLALSGGSVRGLAHIGVVKALLEAGVRPAFITGTSAGSLIGAMFAAGLEWTDIADLARRTFWPKLLYGDTLERFCANHLPATFAGLKIPFAAVTTELPARRTLILNSGNLASAISASCALRGVRRPVEREGKRLKDGGIACVLPSEACRAMGAEFIVGSDVWELSSLLRGLGMHPHHPRAHRTYPSHYRFAVRDTDLLINPRVPLAGYLPRPLAVERMISAGENATHLALTALAARAA
jgi:NTE family protein